MALRQQQAGRDLASGGRGSALKRGHGEIIIIGIFAWCGVILAAAGAAFLWYGQAGDTTAAKQAPYKKADQQRIATRQASSKQKSERRQRNEWLNRLSRNVEPLQATEPTAPASRATVSAKPLPIKAVTSAPLAPLKPTEPASQNAGLKTGTGLKSGAEKPGAGPESGPISSPPPMIGKANRPAIAIVMDDLGHSPARVRSVIALPGPLTLAFLPNGKALPRLTAAARQAGHEIFLHLPMEPNGSDADPGPNALLTGLSPLELDRRIEWNLSQFEGYVGINNHMGSRFTSSAKDLAPVLARIKARGLLFLDSKTTGNSLAYRLAQSAGIRSAQRDIFLDNNRDPAAVEKQLLRTVKLARRSGQAIAIGHPYPETIAALRKWLPNLHAEGLRLVPVSALMSRSAPDRPKNLSRATGFQQSAKSP